MTAADAKIKLHWLNGSRAQAILWLLEELEVPYELEVYHRQPNFLAPPELEKIHPLGKSPLITITTSDGDSKVLAESGFIMQYLCEHFGKGKSLVPKRWKDGQEGQLGGETEEWMRFQYTLYYSEGSFMPYAWLHLILSTIKGPAVPFFVRPISAMISNKVSSMLVYPNIKRHFTFLERQLETSPNGGSYLAGEHLTAADIIMSYPLIAGKNSFNGMGQWEKGTIQETYPKAFAYISRLENEPGWTRSADKIREIDGKFSVSPRDDI